jgi:hypothetical protein
MSFKRYGSTVCGNPSRLRQGNDFDQLRLGASKSDTHTSLEGESAKADRKRAAAETDDSNFAPRARHRAQDIMCKRCR